MNTIKIFDFCTRNPSRLDELVKIRISDGFVKSPRSRVADRDSELERANRKSITIFSVDIRRMSKPKE